MPQQADLDRAEPQFGRESGERAGPGERLQRRVLLTVFPQIARGFLEDAKKRLGVLENPSDEELTDLFEATRTLVFRLLFLLYAESRDLLADGEASYLSVNLRKMRQVTAATGPGELDEETALYDRLLRLFQTVNESDPFLDRPPQTGALFGRSPDDLNARDDRIARFLLVHKVPNRRLAFAIDALSRDRDESTGALALIDYRSFEVWRLGAIYEAILDTNLRLAQKKGRRASGGRKPPETALELTNERTGRKSSGSYYTPAAIVEYLVANTIGPVLEEKLQDARPDFRSSTTPKSASMARPKNAPAGQSPRQWNPRPGTTSANRFDQRRDLVEPLLDLRVIDPAMGCGRFLTEAVNFITGRLLDFLEEFPSHPIGFALKSARQACLQSLAARRQKNEPATLSDRLLLKQLVLRDCLYGVDLDPMAVELAKVSLWLDAGISGMPIRIFDDHLRCGNALVGDLSTSERPGQFVRGADLRFFHWAKEFRDAYGPFGHLQTPCGAGFDCVVGNPPYVRIQNLDGTLVDYLEQKFETAKGKFDLYIPFLERGTGLLRPNGLLGMIVSNKFLTADYGAAFRRFATRNRLVRQLVDFESVQLFPGASAYCCLVFLGRRDSNTITVSRGFAQPPVARETAVIACERFGEAPWSVQSRSPPCSDDGIPLKSTCRAIFQGLITGADRLLIGTREGESIRLDTDCVVFDREIFRPVLKGPDVRRFALRFSDHYVLYPYREINGRTELMPAEEIGARHPGVYRYLCEHRRELENRGSAAMTYPAWYAHWCPRTLDRFRAPKIVTQVLAARASFALDRRGDYTFVGGGNAGVYGIVPAFAEEDRLWLLLAILNSRTFDSQVQARSSRFRGGYYSYARRFIENAAIPQIQAVDFSSSLPRRIVDLAKERAACDADENASPASGLDAAVDELYQCGIR